MISHTISLPIVGVSIILYNGGEITFARTVTMVATGLIIGLIAGLTFKLLTKRKRKTT